jgi:P27 family predicted phage terminase small subunit
MTGRRPKSTTEKRLHGNPGRRPLPKNELEPERGIPEPPEWLSDVALEHWRTLAPELDAAGVLTVADGHALAMLCEAHAEWRSASEAIEQKGEVYTKVTAAGKSTPVARPEVAMRSDAWSRMKSMLAEFGLTPSSRSRVSATPQAPSGKLARFLEGG